MSPIKKNVSQVDKPVQRNLADQKFKQVRSRTEADTRPEEAVVAQEDLIENKEVDLAAPPVAENMGDRPVLFAQLDKAVKSEEDDDDKGLLLLKGSLPAGLGETSSASAGATAGAAKGGLSWLPVAGGVAAVGVVTSGKGGGGKTADDQRETVIVGVESVAITSVTGAQNNVFNAGDEDTTGISTTSILNTGDVVTVTVSMSDVVQVSGTPQLALTIGSTVVQANYVSGSNTNQLVFSYTIQAGQMDGNGIAIAANALQLNGGSIRNAAGDGDAVLTHAAVADSVNYGVDAIAPEISRMRIEIETGEGDIVKVYVTVTEMFTVSGTPQLAINLGGVSVLADYETGYGRTLVFSYPISGGLTYHNGVEIAADALRLNGGTIRDVAGNDLVLTNAPVVLLNVFATALTVTDNAFASMQSNAPSTAYLVHDSVAVTSLADITGAAGNQWNSVSINAANTVTFMETNGLSAGTYRVYAVDAAGNLAQASNSVMIVSGSVTASPMQLSAIEGGSGGFAINGQAAGDRSGYSVSGAGDVNGDGLADLIVGAWNAGAGAGKSYVVFGKNTGTAIDLTAVVAGTGGFVINGQAAGDYSGASVSGAGDVNGDGLADLIVGARNANGSAGRSYVVFGKNTGTAIDLSAVVAGTGGFAINGQAVNDNSGYSVSGAGDVNGDGLADLIVGASRASADAGKSYVVFGKRTGTAINLSAIEGGAGGFVINGQAAGDLSGYSVSGAGDVNGDGLADLIVGALNASGDAGKSYVVFGKSTGTAIDLTAVEGGTGGFVINGEATNDHSGVSVLGAGDVNGDGLADLIVGAYNAGGSAGKSYVVFGKSTGTAIDLSAVAGGAGGFVINGQAAGDVSGYSVSAAGDVNGDGLADLIVGARGASPGGLSAAGRSYVVFGKNTGTAIDLADIEAGTGGFVINGQAAGDVSGYSVSAAGDVNGDGLADLIVSATGVSSGAGKSYVILGSTTGAFNQTAVDALGTSGDDNLNDAGVARTLVGDAGNDSFVATAASVLYGGMGDDNFSIGSTMITALQSNYGAGGNVNQLAQVGGGTGVDTLNLVGSGLTLDLTQIANQGAGYEEVASRLSSIEKIDLTGSGNNTLRLAVGDLLDMSGVNDLLGLSSFAGRHQLAVNGNAGDQVVITDMSSWGLTGSYTVGGVEYAAYNHNTTLATLFVQTGVTVL